LTILLTHSAITAGRKASGIGEYAALASADACPARNSNARIQWRDPCAGGYPALGMLATGGVLAALSPIVVGSVALNLCVPKYDGYCDCVVGPLDPSGHVAGTITIGFEFYPHSASVFLHRSPGATLSQHGDNPMRPRSMASDALRGGREPEDTFRLCG
jgi:hypothetical protein